MDIQNILEEKVNQFRKSWNTNSSDWAMVESTLLFEGKLFVSFCREYSVGTDQNAYSMVYVFDKSSDPSRLYYEKFWDGCPEWRDASLFFQRIVSAERSGKTIKIKFKTEDGLDRELSYRE